MTPPLSPIQVCLLAKYVRDSLLEHPFDEETLWSHENTSEDPDPWEVALREKVASPGSVLPKWEILKSEHQELLEFLVEYYLP